MPYPIPTYGIILNVNADNLIPHWRKLNDLTSFLLTFNFYLFYCTTLFFVLPSGDTFCRIAHGQWFPIIHVNFLLYSTCLDGFYFLGYRTHPTVCDLIIHPRSDATNLLFTSDPPPVASAWFANCSSAVRGSLTLFASDYLPWTWYKPGTFEYFGHILTFAPFLTEFWARDTRYWCL